MMYTSLLIVEDDALLAESIKSFAEDTFDKVLTAKNIQEAQRLIIAHNPHVILLDNRLPDGHAINYIKTFKEISPLSEIIVMTAYGDSNTIVKSIKLGAFHYIPKPFEVDELLNLLKRALEQVKNHLSQYPNIELIGNSPPMVKIKEIINRIKDFDIPVLITGETGTGKEMVAKMIHYTSKKKYLPFIAVNCSAIPHELFESEMFGYEKGAFTGADKRKIGLLEEAGEGTLFLDEIGDMPLELQAKLLRVLEEKNFRRLGGIQDIPFKGRLIAATNKDLEDRVRKGEFRDDLFFRLNVINIKIPPLRNRKEDIPLLVEHFIDFYSHKYNKKITGVSPRLLEKLLGYDWPGNIRELKNIIERAVILSDKGILDIEDVIFPLKSRDEINIQKKLLSLKEVEKNHIVQVLKATRGNKSEAARLLGITRTTLRKKIKEYGIKV